MVFHSYLAGYMGGGVLRWSGWMGVDLFFALSGFLIGCQVFAPLAAGRRLDFVDFYLRRSFRTLPAYFVVLAIYVAWPAARETSGMMPLWQFLTYTLNLFIDPGRSAFSHAWSLCVEEQFYVLFPLLAVLLAWRGSWRQTALVMALLVLGGMLLRAVLWMHGLQPVLARGGDASSTYLRLLYYPTYARLDDLLAGVGLAAMRCYGTRGWAWVQRHPNGVAGLGIVLTAICMAGFDGHRYSFAGNVFGYPLLALAMMALVASAATGRGVLSRWQVPGVRWLALASYSLYLSHKMVYGALHKHFAAWVDGHGYATVLIYAAAVLAVGAGLHYAVERPFLQLRERVRRWRRQRLEASDAAALVPAVESVAVD